MLYQLYQKQVEAWKERFGAIKHRGFPQNALLSSRHEDTIELIEVTKNMLGGHDFKDYLVGVLHGDGAERNANADLIMRKILTILEEQIKLIQKEQ